MENWPEIIKSPTWYQTLYPELKALKQQWEEDPQAESKEQVRLFFQENYDNGSLRLATEGMDLDHERLPVDSLVIHHTSHQPPYDLGRMNIVQMLNVYVPYFNNPTTPGEEGLKGTPLWSGHLRDGKPVFWLYHWLVRQDGSTERLLEDNQLGWHAANWELNRRSVAICLDGDYSEGDPPAAMLAGAARLIQDNYPEISPRRLYGHGEVSKTDTGCPGKNFAVWKRLLQS